jgi:hypothetical protein
MGTTRSTRCNFRSSADSATDFCGRRSICGRMVSRTHRSAPARVWHFRTNPRKVNKLERAESKEYDGPLPMHSTQVARLLAYVTGMVNQQLLLQNEYLLAENRIFRAHLPSRLLLTDPERATLAVIGKRLGRHGLEPVASAAKPNTILAWFRKLVAHKFDGSRHRLYPGRPPSVGTSRN